MELVIRFGFGVDIPWVKKSEDGSGLLAICGPDMTVLRTPVETRGEDMTTVADFEVGEGETVPFVLTYGPSHLEVPGPINPAQALQETEDFWTEWCSRCTYQGESRDLVMRSLITLKALTYAPTGGIVAAPTTSLPEKLGGARNWDYRFCWLRDATFTLLALMNSGYTEEASCWHDWLRRAVAGAPASMQIMYGIMGRRRLLEWEAGWLPGYEGAQPVRIGNAAHAQLQLDVYGELIDAFHQSRVAKLKLDDGTWDLECKVLEHLAEVWDQPDNGIWERRGDGAHYVSSKVMTWVAFDRAVKSAEMFGFEAPLDRWRQLRDTIHRDVCENGFDREMNAFVQSYGSRLLDASILLLPSVGFLPASDPRVRGTLEAIEKYLMRDGFVLRHDPRELRTDRSRAADRGRISRLQPLARRRLCAGGRDRQGAGAVRPGGRGGQRSRPAGRGVRFRRTAPDRQFPAGADPHRADQHRPQSQRRHGCEGQAGDAALEVAGAVIPGWCVGSTRPQMRNGASGNIEIPGSMLSHRPGMTASDGSLRGACHRRASARPFAAPITPPRCASGSFRSRRQIPPQRSTP